MGIIRRLVPVGKSTPSWSNGYQSTENFTARSMAGTGHDRACQVDRVIALDDASNDVLERRQAVHHGRIAQAMIGEDAGEITRFVV